MVKSEESLARDGYAGLVNRRTSISTSNGQHYRMIEGTPIVRVTKED